MNVSSNFLVSIDAEGLQEIPDEKNDSDESNGSSSEDVEEEVDNSHEKNIHPPEKKLKFDFDVEQSFRRNYTKAPESLKVPALPLMPYRCTICSFTASETEVLEEHANIFHRDETIFSCNFCSYEDFFQDTVRHYATVHNSNEYYELIRSQTVISDADIAKNYVRNGRYGCKQCDFHHEKFTKLKLHMKEAHSESPYICSLCPFNGCDLSSLRSHLTSYHKKVEPYKCLLCEYTSDKFRNVQLHANSNHDLIKPLGCSLCSYKTGMAVELRKHLRMHLEKETFKCYLCYEMFDNPRNIITHFRDQHSKRGMYKCPQCPLAYHVFKELLNHESVDHNVCKPFFCNMCSFSTSTLKNFFKHSESRHKESDIKKTIHFEPSVSKVFVDTMEKFVEQERGRITYKKGIKSMIKLPRPQILHESVLPNPTPPKKMYVCHLCDFKSTYVTLLRNHITFVHVRSKVKTEVDPDKNLHEPIVQISMPKVKTEIEEEADPNIRKSRRKVSVPVKFQNNNKCDYCNFVAKTGELLSRHINVFHKRQARFTPSPVKNPHVSKDPEQDHEQTVIKPLPQFTKAGIKRGRPKKIDSANHDEVIIKNEEETNEFLANITVDDTDFSMVPEGMDVVTTPSQYRNCLLCDFETDRADHLTSHLMEQHMEVIGKKTCYHCKMEFDDVERLRFHVAVAHENPDTYLCGFCGLSIPTSHLLEAHVHYKHRKDPTYNCFHCSTQCRSLKVFKDHLEKDHMARAEPTYDQLYPCAHCSFATHSHILFNKHITRIHPDATHYLCKFCTQVSPDFQSWKRHLFTVHHKIKEFNCPFCTYFCARKMQLKQHALRKHKEWAKTL